MPLKSLRNKGVKEMIVLLHLYTVIESEKHILRKSGLVSRYGQVVIASIHNNITSSMNAQRK